MKISIIVCTYNRDKYLYGALECIAKNSFDAANYEVVLVNNNSTDTTESECRRFMEAFPDLDFRYFVETRQGLSHARNRGIAESSGDVLVFLDDDSFVKSDYLTNLAENMEKYPQAMAFGGKITPRFETGEAPKWLCKWTYSWVSAIDKGAEVTLFEGNSYPIGANMGFRKQCVEKCGVFNTALGRSKKNLMGGEEKDIFNRVKEHDMPIYYFPNIEVEHVIPPTRTTKEYIVNMGKGIGMSERMRCRNIGTGAMQKRHFSECVKWGGTLVLWCKYALVGEFEKANILVAFRKNVTKGLYTNPDSEK